MYKIILLDIDDTLFDYSKTASYAIKKVFEDFGYFDKDNVSEFEEIKKEYNIINYLLWRKLEIGEIDMDTLKIERFKMLFEKMKMDYNIKDFSRQYLKRMGEGVFLFEGAEKLCEYLYKKYKLGIITNGMKEVQYSRVNNSTIGKYIDKIIVSDDVGISKPNAEIFEYALKEMGHNNKKDVIMVGDSLTADIQGGINFGIDTCWVNLKNKEADEKIKPKYAVTRLEEIYDIL